MFVLLPGFFIRKLRRGKTDLWKKVLFIYSIYIQYFEAKRFEEEVKNIKNTKTHLLLKMDVEIAYKSKSTSKDLFCPGARRIYNSQP